MSKIAIITAIFAMSGIFFKLYQLLVVNPGCTVTLENGVLMGEHRDNYVAFEGIPYAEPPIGDNRFEAPKPYKTLWGVRQANQLSDVCIQWDHFRFTDRVHGSEDCLYLNIYTPNINPTEKYPVIFYIHGGAYMFGSGMLFGPKYLLQKPVVLVNFNYRLGPLGFLSTQDKACPGNNGLKDQNLALQWVNKNIDRFGGDSDQITIAGFSAGGGSVNLHFLSEMSRGLFRAGVSHSGSALNPWIFQKDPVLKARTVAEKMNCPTLTSTTMIKCLKDKPAHDIVETAKFFQPYLYNPFNTFGVVVEPETGDNFLTDTPTNLMKAGKSAPVPWLASVTADEGVYGAAEFAMDNRYLEDLDMHWDLAAPHILDFNFTIPPAKHLDASRKIRKFYLDDRPINFNSLPTVIKIVTDRLYFVGIQQSALHTSQAGKTPTYFYYFRFNAIYGVEHMFVPDPKLDLGVAHGDDVLLIYDFPIRDHVPFTEDELKMQKLLLEFYFNFVKYGTLKFGKKVIEETKVNAKDGTFTYFDIESPTSYEMKTSKDLANREFWKTILPDA